MQFINKLRECDLDTTYPEEIITYETIVQYDPHEYYDHVNYKLQKYTSGKENFQEQNSLLKAYTVAVYNLVSKAFRKVDFKSFLSGNGNIYNGGYSDRSYVIFKNYGKKGHIQAALFAGFRNPDPTNTKNRVSADPANTY